MFVSLMALLVLGAAPAPLTDGDRRELRAMWSELPAHGVVPIDPLPSGDDDNTSMSLASQLVEVFAPGSLSRGDRAALMNTRPLAPAIHALVPTHRRYQAIQKALAHAVRIRSEGQPHLRRAPYTVRVGTTAPEVATLRDRLRFEGYGDAGVQGRLRAYYDPRLKRALWRWQRDHNLPQTVILDHLTRRRLNQPVPNPVAKLALALARWRALDLREDRGRQLIIDLADYRAVAEEDGVAAVGMKVVIGKPDDANRTPHRSTRLHTIVANPDWRIPKRIVEESLRPRAEEVPEVLIDEGYEVRVDHKNVWWVRQPPGPTNPLGRLKFKLERTRAVYLHDTPARDAFDKAERALSHGCVRLHDPETLGRWLVDSPAALDEALAGSDTVRFKLEAPVPTHLVYQTAVVGADGGVVLRPDVYQQDAAALAEIDAEAVERALNALNRSVPSPDESAQADPP